MKRIIILIGLVLASPILAQAQNAGWQIPPGANTPRALNTPGTPMNRANIDVWGNQLISLSAGTASATNPIKLEDSASASGDAGITPLLVRRDTPSTETGSDGDYMFAAGNSRGAQYVAINAAADPLQTLSILKLEDSVHASGDAGVFSLGVSNLDLGGALCSGSGDYCPIATNINGAVYTNLAVSNNAISPVRSEDAVHASGDALINIGGVLRSALSAVAAVGDYSNIQLDESGRLITTSAPSAELLQGCNTAITTSTTGTIINATASKFNYITGFTCTNTGATGTRIIIEDGDGVDMANAFVVGLTGYATATFPGAGIKTNAVNKTIQVNVITAGSSTICCVSGHVGV